MANGKTSQSNEAKNLLQPTSYTTIDHRGQLVISKEIRDTYNLKAGDRLALFVQKGNTNTPNKIIMINVKELYDFERMKNALR